RRVGQPWSTLRWRAHPGAARCKGMKTMPTTLREREVPPAAEAMPSAVLGRIGGLEVRLATTAEERDAAAALRYEVFFEEGGGRADALATLLRRDVDRFDSVCDHLVVVDRDEGAIVATCRLIGEAVAKAQGGFYSAAEF